MTKGPQTVEQWASERGVILLGPPGFQRVIRMCPNCAGSGRVPGARKDTTRNCPTCYAYRKCLPSGRVPA